MLKVGLTGGIGSGKSTVAQLLRAEGLEIIDADQIARDIVRPGKPALTELAREFGADIVGEDGELRRGELASRAFSSAERTERLNAITHPRIEEETARRFAAAEASGEKAVVYDMPLLVEQGLDKIMDLVAVVDVDAEERVRRLVDSRGMDEADARRRIAAQVGDAERRAAADIVIGNNGPKDRLGVQVSALAREIARRASV